MPYSEHPKLEVTNCDFKFAFLFKITICDLELAFAGK
jgi:hypothetical protein